MKKVIKITAITLSAIVVLLGVTTLILGLVTVNPLKDFGGYDRVYVLESFGGSREYDPNNKTMIEDGMAKTKFSILRSIVDGNTDYGIVLNTKELEDDEDEAEPVRIAAKDVGAEINANEGEFMIELSYESEYRQHERLRDEEGEQIWFDKLIIIIGAPAKTKLQTIRIYPYIQYNLVNDIDPMMLEPDENHHINPENYYIYEFVGKIPVAGFYQLLLDNGFAPMGQSGNA